MGVYQHTQQGCMFLHADETQNTTSPQPQLLRQHFLLVRAAPLLSAEQGGVEWSGVEWHEVESGEWRVESGCVLRVCFKGTWGKAMGASKSIQSTVQNMLTHAWVLGCGEGLPQSERCNKWHGESSAGFPSLLPLDHFGSWPLQIAKTAECHNGANNLFSPPFL